MFVQIGFGGMLFFSMRQIASMSNILVIWNPRPLSGLMSCGRGGSNLLRYCNSSFELTSREAEAALHLDAIAFGISCGRFWCRRVRLDSASRSCYRNLVEGLDTARRLQQEGYRE